MNSCNRTPDAASIRRRDFLYGSGALAAASGASQVFAKAAPSGAPLADWDSAPTIPLWPQGTPQGGYRKQIITKPMPPIFLRNIAQPYLRVFRPKTSNGRALMSMPGGAYTFVSIANEGLEVARDMTRRGYTVFVLVYRLPGEGWMGREDVPLQDAQRAMRLIRSQAAAFGFSPDQVYAVGFSAGGHLGATLATDFASGVYAAQDGADELSARPRAVGLIYPVISQVEGIGHAESTLRLLGPDPAMEKIVERSPDLHVTHNTPPIFLVHAMDDPAVPLENSLLMMGALRGHGRPVEAHFFEHGGHGFGTGADGEPASAWPTLFANWMDSHAGAAGADED